MAEDKAKTRRELVRKTADSQAALRKKQEEQQAADQAKESGKKTTGR